MFPSVVLGSAIRVRTDVRAFCASQAGGTQAEGGVAMMDGWDWLWMPFAMGLWLLVIGAVVYIAVRLAQRPPRAGHP